MSGPESFEQVYRRYPFADLVAFAIAAARALVRARARRAARHAATGTTQPAR